MIGSFAFSSGRRIAGRLGRIGGMIDAGDSVVIRSASLPLANHQLGGREKAVHVGSCLSCTTRRLARGFVECVCSITGSSKANTSVGSFLAPANAAG